jgi:hypothetical protein
MSRRIRPNGTEALTDPELPPLHREAVMLHVGVTSDEGTSRGGSRFRIRAVTDHACVPGSVGVIVLLSVNDM